VRFAGDTAEIPVPNLHGAIVLKATAAVADSRDAARHVNDLAFLCSLVADPLEMRADFKGSDARRLRTAAGVLGDPRAACWRQLGEYAEDAHTVWTLLTRP